MKKIRFLVMLLAAAMIFAFPLAGCSKQSESEEPAEAETETEAETTEEEGSVIDYMVLVNQSNQLPDGWEEALETTTVTNSVGDEVYVEALRYAGRYVQQRTGNVYRKPDQHTLAVVDLLGQHRGE